MPLATRHRDDPSPQLEPKIDLVVRRESDTAAMAAVQGRSEAEMAARLAVGHRAYVACIGSVPAGFGWVATRTADIGELGTSFSIPADERYLWNFVTLRAYRGLGVYPRLLDAIVRAESLEASRFWIAYAPENHASGSGIRKAGFATVADLSFDRAGQPALKVLPSQSLPTLPLGLPETDVALAQCWRCSRAVVPRVTHCAEGSCGCDYQLPDVACAA